MTKILVVDDHDVVRQGVRGLLGKPGWEVVAEASDGLAAVEAAEMTRPDILIIDYSLPSMNGADVVRRVREMLPETEALIFTMHDEEEIVRDALGAGAIGFVLKSDGGRELVTAVEALSRHQPYFTAKVNARLLRSFLESGKRIGDETVLSPRERQVITLLADGKNCREAAEILGIGTKTAETHRASAMRKLGVTTSAALVRYAIRNKLVQA
jgi:DNA-binding NarL/FixJ family response regulator